MKARSLAMSASPEFGFYDLYVTKSSSQDRIKYSEDACFPLAFLALSDLNLWLALFLGIIRSVVSL